MVKLKRFLKIVQKDFMFGFGSIDKLFLCVNLLLKSLICISILNLSVKMQPYKHICINHHGHSQLHRDKHTYLKTRTIHVQWSMRVLHKLVNNGGEEIAFSFKF